MNLTEQINQTTKLIRDNELAHYQKRAWDAEVENTRLHGQIARLEDENADLRQDLAEMVVL